MDERDDIAQWVIDNRYPKSELEKISDLEMYFMIKSMIESKNNTEPIVLDEKSLLVDYSNYLMKYSSIKIVMEDIEEYLKQKLVEHTDAK